MIGMETKINGLQVQIYPDTISPEKVIITGYNSDYNEPLNDMNDILLELDNNCIWHGVDSGGYSYLHDEAGFRYSASIGSMTTEFQDDMEKLVSGKIDKVEYYRDKDFLRPQDIQELKDEGKLFDVHDNDKLRFNCSLIKIEWENDLVIFRDEECKIFSIGIDDTENVSVANE